MATSGAKDNIQRGARNVALKLHRALLAYMRRRQLLQQLRGDSPPLSPIELSIMLEIRESSQGVSQLAEKLGLERTWLSRLVAALVKRGLLSSTPSPLDSRTQLLTLSLAGRSLLQAALLSHSELITASLQPLRPAEQSKLAERLQQLADSCKLPSYAPLPRVHSISLNLFRLGRAGQLHSSNYLGTGLTIAQLQVLERLAIEFPSGASITDIATGLPFDSSSISRAVAVFTSRKFVQRGRLKDDRRQSVIRITSNGEALLGKYFESASGIFRDAAKSLGGVVVDELLTLLERVSLSADSTIALSLAEGLAIRRLKTSELSSKTITHFHLPRDLLRSAGMQAFGYYIADTLRAIALTRAPPGKGASSLFLSTDGLDAEACSRFLRHLR